MRPNSRRSVGSPANSSPVAEPLQHYHEKQDASSGLDPYWPPDRYPRSGNSQNRPSPVSPTPPLLPPITRVTSPSGLITQERGNKNSLQHHWSFKGTSNRPNGLTMLNSSTNTIKRAEELTFSASGNDRLLFDSQNVSSPELSENGRRRRPIDIRFEQMRSYSEQPFQQSIYMQPNYIPGIPQPYTPPPPPRAVQAPSQQPEIPHHSNLSSNTPPLPKKSSESRYHTWNNRVFDRPHCYIPVQGATSPQPAQQQLSSNQPRQSKKKRGILQAPFDLLAKRRSQSAAEAAYAESQNLPALQLPDDYDPRIRGKGVHDFSAPRPGRNQSSRHGQETDQEPQRKVEQKHSTMWESRPNSAEREHAPVFKEQFDDGLERSENPANRSAAFMQQMAIQASQSEPEQSELPAFARKLPSTFAMDKDVPNKAAPLQSSASLGVLIESPDTDQIPALPSPPMSTPRAGSRATSLSERNRLDSPKRYMSNASRFSFDLTGVGSSAQEKLLEDKHRQNAQRQQRQSTLSDEGLDDEEQYNDYDGIDGYDFEERIPGVNCDEDEETSDERVMPVLQREMESFNFVSPNKSSFESTASLVSTGVTSFETSRDMFGQSASSVASKSTPNLAQTLSREVLSAVGKTVRPRSTPGESSGIIPQPQVLQRDVASETNLQSLPQQQTDLDDDMYFDDGVIDDMDEISNHNFDEEVFDDTSCGLYGLPFRDRTLKPLQDQQHLPNPGRQEEQVEGVTRERNPYVTGNQEKSSPHRSVSSGATSAEVRDAVTELNQPGEPVFNEAVGLTQDNLAAYNHSALSQAVNQAVLKGAFDRTLSLPSLLEQDFTQDNQVTNNPHSNPSAFNDEYSEGGIDDDGIVAAANAEALENDDDGFYDREFNFHAQASGLSEAEYVNGGYFGLRPPEGIHRSHSGKANFQEPSLTPITERSEWSNRNSTISLAVHGYPLSAVSATSPQFNDVPLDDVNMQLAMLQKMRRSAWGGSDASLPSSSNSQHSGSPLTHLPPGVIFPSQPQAGNSNSNSQTLASTMTHSFSSSDGVASSNVNNPSPPISGSPTITFPTPAFTPPQPAAPPPPIPVDVHEYSPETWSGKVKSHGRSDSGAESVSYKEEGGKWVVEKRRMSETGEQMIGRTVIEGGRI